MYLPHDMPGTKILITVKTYPLPSSKYGELVCTAGILPDGKWVRVYPIAFRAMPYDNRYSKYCWITLDLVRNTKDFRPESYKPKFGIEKIEIGEKIDTGKNKDWAERKQYVLKEVFTSMDEIIRRAKSDERKSLATFKPREIVDFVIEEADPEWKQEWQDQSLQYDLFNLDEKGQGKVRNIVRKVPYKYSYKFFADDDTKPRTLMIEDWEIGALYWNSLAQRGGDKDAANRLVTQKYFYEFCSKKDIHLFLGTTRQHHLKAPNPFVIIGVFAPPKLHNPEIKDSKLPDPNPGGLQQKPLFDF